MVVRKPLWIDDLGFGIRGLGLKVWSLGFGLWG